MTYINDASKVEVVIQSFKHDIYGNPIANHTVYIYTEVNGRETLLDVYEQSRRKQVGYSNKYDCNVPDVIRKAGIAFSKCEFVSHEGDRSEDKIVITYKIKG